ncbi:MAG: helicase, partial [Pseudomonadota bacterium]
GFAFRLQETGAAIDLRRDDQSVRIEAEDREALKAIGVRAGRVSAHVPDAQKPAAQKLISILRTIFDGATCPIAPEGAGSFEPDPAWSDGALAANGYIRLGQRAVRADLAERLAWEVSKRRRESETPAFALPPELASIVSCPGDAFPDVIKGLGLAPAEKDPETGVPTLWRYNRRHRPDQSGGKPGGKNRKRKAQGHRPKGARDGRRSHQGGRKSGHDPSSPFAALATLIDTSGDGKPDGQSDSGAEKPDAVSPSLSPNSE